MGHPQPQTPVHRDNATAVGITTNTIKQQRSRSMDMQFFWVGASQEAKVDLINFYFL
jgi:hypothetical protein